MTKAQAQAAYRAGWQSRCLATTKDAQKAAERAMDAVQPFCVGADGLGDGRPGLEWEAFIDTLPGFREQWAEFEKLAAGWAEQMFANTKVK